MKVAHIAWICRGDGSARMESVLSACSVPYTRIEAVDGGGRSWTRHVVNAAFLRPTESRATDAEIAATLSHLKALHFLSVSSTDAEYFLVVEDAGGGHDAASCADAVRRFLADDGDDDRPPANMDMLLIFPTTARSAWPAAGPFERLCSFPFPSASGGLGAYVITRRGASRMLAVFDFDPLTHTFVFLRPEIDAPGPYLVDRLATWRRRTDPLAGPSLSSARGAGPAAGPSLSSARGAGPAAGPIAGAVAHVAYINLDRDVARRNAMEAQLAGCGVAYSRVRAVDPAEYLGRARPLVACDSGAPVRFDTSLSPREVACTLSHLKALRFLATLSEDDDTRFLVLEDDVEFWNAQVWFAPADFGLSPLANILRRAPPRFEALLLYHCLPTVPCTADPPRLLAEFSRTDRHSQTEEGTVAISAAAYVITRGAIRKIFARHVTFDPERDQFFFRDADPLEAADKWVFQRVDTWVYRYNFLAPNHNVVSTLGHPPAAFRLFDFHAHREMLRDTARLGQERICWPAAGPALRALLDDGPAAGPVDQGNQKKTRYHRRDPRTAARGPFSRPVYLGENNSNNNV